VQPFGGEGLSGTGPKAGGPWYLPRLRRDAVPWRQTGIASAPLEALRAWAAARGDAALAATCARHAATTPFGAQIELPGPTGERNTLAWHARGRALCIARDAASLLAQLAAVLATGNTAIVADADEHDALLAALPQAVRAHVAPVADWRRAEVALVLHDAAAPTLAAVRHEFAAHDGARVRVVTPHADGGYELAWLLAERVVSVNTAAAGGNASLMTLGAT
jgi:RHH-type proline utilization regulon transcriptional repressor/proline dehydrogenase/delta 1-pyrroline-5-carboxylate dehydrogenase